MAERKSTETVCRQLGAHFFELAKSTRSAQKGASACDGERMALMTMRTAFIAGE
jgi:hypothetical protein